VLRQEDCGFQASLGYIARPFRKKKSSDENNCLLSLPGLGEWMRGYKGNHFVNSTVFVIL
jgi:hypothetical protein